MTLYDAAAEKPNPIFWIESRPSTIDGFSWHAMLSYKEHHFEAVLPKEWPSWDDAGKSLALQPIFDRLRAELAPILIAEDRDGQPATVSGDEGPVEIAESEGSWPSIIIPFDRASSEKRS